MKEIFDSFVKSTKQLELILKVRKSVSVRDSAIKRFELTFELSWKILQKVLRDEGIVCRSPKESFREAFKFGLMKNEELWLQMLADRNLSVHTYSETLADDLYNRLKKYLTLFKSLKAKLSDKF